MANDNIFSGLKVVDFSSFVAGPSAAVILSDFGADVIKVEPPSGDPWRHGNQVPPQPLAKDAVSVSSHQPQQAQHDARSEIAERAAGACRSSSSGPTYSSSTRRTPRARN